MKWVKKQSSNEIQIDVAHRIRNVLEPAYPRVTPDVLIGLIRLTAVLAQQLQVDADAVVAFFMSCYGDSTTIDKRGS